MIKSKRLRAWYTFLVILFPAYWIRTVSSYNEAWDIWLWNALIDGKTDFVGEYEAVIDDTPVWIANHPYASGTSVADTGIDVHGCSRVTAMLLRRSLPAGRVISKLKYGNETSVWVGEQLVM